MTKRIPLKERFWSKVKKTKTCWLWTGHIEKDGYGSIFVLKYKRPCRAHRFVLEISGIEIPEGLVVDHKCRNRACVNPAHLRIVTRRTNVLENSNSLQAKNFLKTKCIRGHPLSGHNLVKVKAGKSRRCRICSNEGQNKRNREKANYRRP